MSRNALVFVLLALLAGGAAGYLVGQGAEPAPPAPFEEDRPSSGPGRTFERDDGGDRSERPGMRSVSLDVPTGDGVIAGRVAKKNGEGIPGVTVRAFLAVLPRPDDDGRPPEAGASIDHLVHAARLARASRREVVTGEDGSFRLDGMADRPYRVEAYRAGLTLTSDRADRVWPGQSVEFVAKPRILLPVEVRLPDGGSPAEAELTLGGSSRRMDRFEHMRLGLQPPKPRTWAPDRSSLALGPGKYELSASAGRYGEMRSKPVKVSLRENEEPETVVLQLEARPGIRGTVRFEDGIVESSSAVYVCLVEGAPGEEPSEDELRRGRRFPASAGAGLAYVIPDLEPGSYWLGVTVSWRLRTKAPVTVAAGLVEKDLVIPAPGPGETFVARVVGPGGETLDNATFQVMVRHSAGGNSSYGLATASLPDGTYRLRPMKPTQVLPGETRTFLVVRIPDLGVEEIELGSDTSGTVTVTFQKPAGLTVHLEGARPEQLAKVYVYLSRVAAMGQGISANPRSGFGSRPEKGKTRTFEGLQPGRYKMSASIRGGFGSSTLETREIVVGAAGGRETIVIPPLHELTVIVEDETHGYFQLMSGRRQYGGFMARPEKGRAVFRNVPAGRYTLTSYSKTAGQVGMTVEIPAQSTVTFAGKPLSALRVRIEDEGGLLATAGFLAGDLIVGVNGEAFETAQGRQAKMMLAGQKSPARFMVRRGNRRIEISFDAKTLSSRRRELGGWLAPAASR